VPIRDHFDNAIAINVSATETDPQAQRLTVPAVIHAHAAADDGAEFLRLIGENQEDRIVSYAGLVAEAERWAAFYAAHGLCAGERVIVVLPHSLDVYAAYIGALLGGLVPAMFAFPSPKFSEREYFRNVGTLISTAGSGMLVTYPELAAKLERRERTALGSAQLVTPAMLPAGETSAERAPATAPRPEDPAFVQYSSGTTGMKKGVAVSHRALLWQIDAYAHAIEAGAADRIVSWLPLYHDMGLIACLFLPLLKRIPLVAMSPFHWVRTPSLWTDAVTEHRSTLSWLPNFAYNFLAANVRGDALARADLSSLRGIVNCSEPIMASSHRAFLERFADHGASPGQLAVSYAMAENTFAVTSGGFGRPPAAESVDSERFDREHRAQPVPEGSAGARLLVSSGRPLPDHELEILGPDGRTLGEREVGEITLRSPCLMSGYDRNPDASAEALRDGRYHTGDLGYLAGGELFVTGRARDLIIVGGRNIYPQDVETVVEGIEGVVPGRVVAVGLPDSRMGTETLAVLVETRERDVATRERLRQEVHAAVAERTEVVPHVVRVLDHRSLLKSSSGKPARGANREKFLSETAPADTATARVADEPVVDLAATARRVVEDVLANLGDEAGAVDESTPLVTSGRIDSFGLVELFAGLEDVSGLTIGAEVRGETERFDTIAAIAQTLAAIGGGTVAPTATPGAPVTRLDPDAIPMRYGDRIVPRAVHGFWTRYYQVVFRLRGIRCGPGLSVLGPILLQIDGSAANIRLGANITLMPGAHLKNRERGRIILHDGVKLDTMARLVAANDARIELGERVALGIGTVINAGRDVVLGRGCLTAPHCVINASDHGIAAGAPIQSQPFDHAPIHIDEDVWLGAGVVVSRGSRIGAGAVISAGSTVSGAVPPGAIVHGSPARPVKYRR
jgi:fatty-acyl-CoA synthase